jgi:hypothetical protein
MVGRRYRHVIPRGGRTANNVTSNGEENILKKGIGISLKVILNV